MNCASNMQSIYNDFTAWLEKFCPEHVHIWCYENILNLAITNVTNWSLKVAYLFTLLINGAISFKESNKIMSL